VHLISRVGAAARLLPTLLKQTVVKGWHDRVLGLSAEAAFWQMLSLPSLFLALVAALGYLSRDLGIGSVDQVQTHIESTVARAFDQQVVNSVIDPTLNEVLRSGRASVISIGFVLALWAGSSATATFVNTITIAYGMRDLRGPVRSRLLALWLFLASVVLGVFMLPMLVLGPDLLRRAFPDSVRPTVSTVIELGYYPVLVAVLMLGLTTFYKLAPPRRLPWHRGVPGAVLAVLVFLAGSAGLRAYIHFVLDHNHAYGALAAPIAALLFFFVLALGVLLGAELNAAIESARPSRQKPPRILHPRNWQQFRPDDPPAGDDNPDDGGPAAEPPSTAPRRRLAAVARVPLRRRTPRLPPPLGSTE
jgi:membrane protein